MQNSARIGGILSIVAGSFGIFYLMGLIITVLAFSIARVEPSNFHDGYMSLGFMFVIIILGGFTLLGVLSLIGGIFAIKRRNWGLALAGTIAGTIMFFPAGVPAIVFVALGRGEFETENTPLHQEQLDAKGRWS